jgi:phage shock protein C
MLFGVAGGMGQYLGVDPVLVRLVWVLLFLAAGTGILLYIIAAIIIPEEPLGYVPPTGAPGTSDAAGAGVTGAAGDAGATQPGTPAGAVPTWGRREPRGNGAILLGIFLVVIGAWFLVQRAFPAIDDRLLWPVVLIALGVLFLGGAMRRRS